MLLVTVLGFFFFFFFFFFFCPFQTIWTYTTGMDLRSCKGLFFELETMYSTILLENDEKG